MQTAKNYQRSYRKVGLENLPDELRKLVELRLEHEDLPLSELGELFEPPLTKSMVYNRFKKLEKLLERERPDVAHLHNIYHQLTPSIITVLKNMALKRY